VHSLTSHWELSSPEETHLLGRALGRAIVGGVVVGLVGPLGAGKTHFVKGVAEGNAHTMSSTPHVSSPTFTLVHEYRGRLTVYHIDAYRLRLPRELIALGFDEFSRPDSAVFVEWADRVQEVMPDARLAFTFRPTGESSRSVDAEAVGPLAQECLSNLTAECPGG